MHKNDLTPKDAKYWQELPKTVASLFLYGKFVKKLQIYAWKESSKKEMCFTDEFVTV